MYTYLTNLGSKSSCMESSTPKMKDTSNHFLELIFYFVLLYKEITELLPPKLSHI